MEIFIPALLFAAGLCVIIYGGDKFVSAASYIAKALGVSEVVIGATVVSLGTTLPEIMVSTISAARCEGEIAVSNAIGSIIFNTGVIAAISLIFASGNVERRSIYWRAAMFFSGLSGLFFLSLNGVVSRRDGGVLLIMFALYAALSVIGDAPVRRNVKARREKIDLKILSINIAAMVFGAAFIFFGAHLMVGNAVLIAEALGVSERIIGITIVAMGTSLPELVTTVTSLLKGHRDLSIGNIIGANIMNILSVIGLSAAVSPLIVKRAALTVDMPTAGLFMAALLVPPLFTKRTFRAQGVILILFYIAYVALFIV